MFEQLRRIIQTRRSIRRYAAQPVPRETLERLLEVAIWAPSAHNRQPWRFALTVEDDTKRRLAEAMGARLRADLAADGVSPAVIEADAARSYARITGAPALVVACLSMADMDRYVDAQRAEAEYLMAVQSTAMALQNLLIAAHTEGFGTCWMCGPLFCPDEVRAALALPPDWQPQALITLGIPAASRESSRFALETRILWR